MTTTAYLAIIGIALIALTIVFIYQNQAKQANDYSDRVIKRLQDHKRHAEDPRPLYAISKEIPSGKIAVEKISLQNGIRFTTVIKVFTDEDQEYNFREAEELIAHLQAK